MIRRTFIALATVAFVLAATPAFAEDKPGTHEGKVVKVEDGKLTMTDKDGKNQHTHAVPIEAVVLIDGKEAKFGDLKPGTAVKVTTEKKADKVLVTKIDAKTS